MRKFLKIEIAKARKNQLKGSQRKKVIIALPVKKIYHFQKYHIFLENIVLNFFLQTFLSPCHVRPRECSLILGGGVYEPQKGKSPTFSSQET